MAQNRELSEIFNEMASITEFLEGSQSFRASAYQNGADALKELDTDIEELAKEQDLTKIEGIGKSIASKIEEYLETGHIKKLDELRGKVPEELVKMMAVKGLGPKTLRKFYDELGIRDRKGLEQALNDGSIEGLEGFGAKKVEKIRRGLQMHDEVKERVLLIQAEEVGNKVLERMKDLPRILRMELAGSLRRRKSTVGDIDLLIAAAEEDRPGIHEAFVNMEHAKEVIAHGTSKSSILLKEHDRQIDLRTVDEEEWGAALHYFTGSQSHNIRMRSLAHEKGWKVSEYGVFDQGTGERIAGKSEEEIYGAFDLQWIPPELREDRGEIEAAREGRVPKLLETNDIQGDLHMHSDFSDGRHSLEEIAKHILEERGDAYLAITDHSKAVGVAGGMDDEGFLEQKKAIETLKERYGEDRIFQGAEVDIRSGGALDLSDHTLEKMDWVVASIHSGMDSDNTERLIKACENPYVNAIGHPTGRLIGSRSAYELDIDAVMKTAQATGTALEINAQAQRMDLDDELAMKAREMGIWLVIDTDMHRLHHLDQRSFGVSVARRAWCTAPDILNARSADRIREVVHRKRENSLSKA